MAFTITPTQTVQARIKNRLGDRLNGNLAHQGDKVVYRITVPFAQPLKALALINDTGSTGVSWSMARVGSPNWSSDQTLSAGEYDLTLTANADTAVYALQLLDASLAVPLPAAGSAAQRAQGRDARVYSYDLKSLQALRVGIDTATAAKLKWALYNDVGNLVSQSAQGLTLETSALAAGPYYLVVTGQTDVANSVDFTVHLAPVSPASNTNSIAIGASISAHLTASDSTRTYSLHVPFGTYVQIHNLGSDSGLVWKLKLVGSSYDDDWNELVSTANTGPDQEVKGPYTRYLGAGDYEFLVSSSAADKNFALQIVDLDNVPELPSAGVVASLGGGTQVAAYRLAVVGGQRLQIDIGSPHATDISWVLFSEDKSVAGQGSSAGAFTTDRLWPNGRYTLLVKGRNSSALGVDYTLNVTPVTLPVLQVGDQIAGIVNPGEQAVKTYRLTIPATGYYQVHNTASEGLISWALSQAGSDYREWVGVPMPASGGVDAEAKYPYTRYLYKGDYDFSVRSEESSHYFGLQIVDLSNAVLLPATGLIGENFLPGKDVAVYRFDAASSGALNVHVQSAEVSTALSWVVYDWSMQVVGQGQGQAEGIQVQTGDSLGPYTLQVKRQSPLTQGLHFTVGMVPVAPTVLQLDSTNSFSLAPNSGTTKKTYAFTLEQRRIVLVDSRNDVGAKYLLRNAQGLELGYGNFLDSPLTPNSDDIESHSVFTLNPGDYTLELWGRNDGATSTTVDFELVNASSASNPTVTLGVPLNGSLPLGNETQVLRLSGLAGDVLNIDVSTGAGASLSQRLFDSNGVKLSLSESGFYQLRTSGTYFLAVDGALGNSPGVTYSVIASLQSHNAFPVANSTAIALGVLSKDMLGHGETKGYSFTLAAHSLVSIGGLSSLGYARWQLRRGQDYVADAGYFASYGHNSTVLELDAGDYSLEVTNDGGDPSDIDFLVEDGSTAVWVPAGASIVASSQSLYKMDLVAGQTYRIRATDYSRWNIYQPNLSLAQNLSDTYYGRVPAFTPLVSGTWYFAFAECGSMGATLEMGAVRPLTIDAEVSSTVLLNGADDSYSITLTKNTCFYLDFLDLDVDARISICQGNSLISDIGVSAASRAAAPITLAAGTYRMDVGAANGSSLHYSLRLRDLAAASALTVNVPVDGVLVPGAAAIYQFEAQAGQTLYYTPVDLGGLTGQWTLYNEFGESVKTGESVQSEILYRLPRTGSYFFVFDTLANANAVGPGVPFRFTLSTTPAIVLPIGRTVQKTFPSGVASLSYTFALNTQTRLLLDVLQADGDDLRWSLKTAGGEVQSGGASTTMVSLFSLRADTYTLTLSSTSPIPATLAFRLLDLQEAESMALGEELSGAAVPGNALVRCIDLIAGDSFDYVPLVTGGLSGSWTLFDPEGYQVATGELATVATIPRLNQSGRYIFVWDTDAGAGGGVPTDYRFAVTTQPPCEICATILRNARTSRPKPAQP